MRQNKDSNLCSLWIRIVLCLFTLSGTSTVLVAQQNLDKPAPSTDSQDVKPTVLVLPSYSQNIAILGTDQRYMDLVYGVCLKYFKDPEKSKDAVMQIFEELIGKLKKHEVENFRGWLHQVAKNHCLMQMTKCYCH